MTPARILCAAALAACVLSGPVRAAVIATGNVEPDPLTTPWTADTDAYIGKTADGSLWVDGGDDLQSGTTWIARDPGVMGETTVTGAGSTWTNKETLEVGRSGRGTLEVVDGATVTINMGTSIGTYSGSTGDVTVRGPGSTWKTGGSFCYVGNFGKGTLTIADGGYVKSRSTFIAFSRGSVGDAEVSGPGSIWTTDELFIGNRGDGALKITDGGLVNSSYNYGYYRQSLIGCQIGAAGNVLVSGQNSQLNVGMLFVGDYGNGILTIADGGTVRNTEDSLIAYRAGSTGAVTVRGEGSTWITERQMQYGFNVGYDGTGTLTILDGGTVNTMSRAYIARNGGSVGKVLVSGPGSTWNHDSTLYVGGGDGAKGGAATLTIADSGTVSGYNSLINGDATVTGPGSTWSLSVGLGVEYGGTLTIADGASVTSGVGRVLGNATVTGAGSTWTNGGSLRVGYQGYGTLSVIDGGTVTSNSTYASDPSSGRVIISGVGSTWADSGYLNVSQAELKVADGGVLAANWLWFHSNPALAIDVAHNSRVIIGGGTGKITNYGTVHLLAGTGPTPGEVFTPILAGTWEGTGKYQAIGGTWDAVGHEFIASPVILASAGKTVGFDAATIQRVLVVDPATGRAVGVSLLALEESTILHVAAAPVEGDVLGQLAAMLETGQAVRGAWEFDVEGYGEGDPAYLSFDVGAGVARENLSVWHHDGEGWTSFDAWDLTYDGQYASFMVDGFSAYAVVAAVPEPGMVVLLAGLVLAAIAARRR
ncbi:MAG: PEP-CTERM sorting domain-containing protein [Pirellulales bacterium]|nr:PEP-CTERM sorting domain-containing protein [Pirellulales bacterium]